MMNAMFRKPSIEEPVFRLLLDRTGAAVSYQLREYGKRIAIETRNRGDSGFMKLAGYIGVFGPPDNQGRIAMKMTTPVVRAGGEGTKIAMTTPVVRDEGMMQFILPAEYDSLQKVPEPTDEAVLVKEIAPSVGAVKRYPGPHDQNLCKKWALELRKQLREDGLDLSEEYVLRSYQFWSYNPPSTPSSLRRNEIWIPLSPEHVASLVATYGEEEWSVKYSLGV